MPTTTKAKAVKPYTKIRMTIRFPSDSTRAQFLSRHPEKLTAILERTAKALTGGVNVTATPVRYRTLTVTFTFPATGRQGVFFATNPEKLRQELEALQRTVAGREGRWDATLR